MPIGRAPPAPPGLLESLPDADLNYSGCALRQIKENDPHISFLEVHLTYCEYRQGRYATTVDWGKEQSTFLNNSNLKRIDIDINTEDNKVKKSLNATAKDYENIKLFVKAIARSMSIREVALNVQDRLNQSDNSIAGDVFKLLFPIFRRLNKLEVTSTLFDNNSIQALKSALEGASDLQEIELICNTTTNEQTGIILDTINEHCSKLKKINIAYDNGEGLLRGNNGFLALANLVSNPSSLEILELCDHYSDLHPINVSEIGDTEAFANALANNSKLKVIRFDLVGVNVFKEREWQIVSSILHNNSIQELHLQKQQIGIGGMNGITQGLSTNTSLKKLDLRDCGGVTWAGWIELLNAIKNNPDLPLEQLEINAFLMRSEVITTSITSILVDKSLKKLTLGGNFTWDFRDEVLIKLSNALVGNDTLTTLDLGYVSGVVESRINNDQSDGLKVLSRIFRSGSSNATFRSNHTLEKVSVRSAVNHRLIALPPHLAWMIQLNGNSNKFEVSRQKILRCHFADYDTQLFVNMGLELLPNAMAWCGGGGGDHRGLSLLYRLAQSHASLIDPSSKKRKKRKRNKDMSWGEYYYF